MSRFLITAFPAEFIASTAYQTIGYSPLGPRLYNTHFEATKTSEVAAELDRVAAQIKAEKPGQSFFINAMLREGRAPHGFKDLRPLEYNAEVDPDCRGPVLLEAQIKANTPPDPQIDGAVYKVVLDNHTLELEPDNVFAALDARGFQHNGYSQSWTLRYELQGRPKFAGLLGPMFDGLTNEGVPIVRYESPAVYAALSA